MLAVVDEVGGLEGARRDRSQAMWRPEPWPEAVL